MIINHPLLGPRDAAEFVYLGDVSLIDRPDTELHGNSNLSEHAGVNRPQEVADAFHEYQFLRDNIAGEHQELWYHEQGDRSWLVVTRNTLTHDIVGVALARDVARSRGRSR